MTDERISLDITAENKEEALAQAQFELGVSAERLMVTVLDEPEPDEGRAGRYHVALRGEADKLGQDGDRDAIAAVSVKTLATLIDFMQFDVEIEAVWSDADDGSDTDVLMLNVDGSELDNLVGPKGETIGALQYLVRLIVARHTHSNVDVVIDIGGYKAKRAKQLKFLAKRIAEQVAESGRAVPLEPMPAHERRVVHVALRGNTAVTTESAGEGSQRRIVIKPAAGEDD